MRLSVRPCMRSCDSLLVQTSPKVSIMVTIIISNVV